MNVVVTGMPEKLGETLLLLRKGRLDQAGLNRALMEASLNGERLGAHRVKNNVLYEEDISVALAEQFGLRYVVIDPRELDPALASLLPVGRPWTRSSASSARATETRTVRPSRGAARRRFLRNS